ncbi:MAG: hypothetical protein ACFFCS_19465, partial [Candidatus Hodarchaeota archaeon]
DIDAKCILTRCKIWSSENSKESNSIPLPANLLEVDPGSYKYMLGIYAPAKDFLKITTYYIKNPFVSKITLGFEKIDSDLIKKISILIKEFDDKPIHVSGFCNKNDKYIYEIYAQGEDENSINVFIDNIKKLGIPFEVDIQDIELNEEI